MAKRTGLAREMNGTCLVFYVLIMCVFKNTTYTMQDRDEDDNLVYASTSDMEKLLTTVLKIQEKSERLRNHYNKKLEKITR